MKNLFNLWVSMILATTLISCQTHFNADNWYAVIKDSIITESNNPIDSIRDIARDGYIYQRFYYSKGLKIMHRYFRGDTSKIAGETRYSKNGNWELRKEFYATGEIAFEGICYKGHFFGKSTWSFANGLPRNQGIRINDEEVGIWKSYNEDGTIKTSVENKQSERIDTLAHMQINR